MSVGILGAGVVGQESSPLHSGLVGKNSFKDVSFSGSTKTFPFSVGVSGEWSPSSYQPRCGPYMACLLGDSEKLFLNSESRAQKSSR